TRPDERAPGLDLWREQLVLEVAVRDTGALYEVEDLLGLGDVAGERFLARNTLELSLPAFERVDDLLHGLDAGVVMAGEPDRVDCGIGAHVGDRRVGFRFAHLELARQGSGGGGVLLVRAPDAAHVGVAHGLPALEMELRVEAGADKADAEGHGGGRRR